MKRYPALILMFFLAFGLFGETVQGDLVNRGNYLTVKVAVMGPGDDLYLWWGHIALVIDDELTGESRFYDWGVFSFDNENFYFNFALGRLLYQCMGSIADWNFSQYRAENRDVTIYTLDLPPEKKTELFIFAENNVRPENKDYYYHHFKDNCATRVRDLVDLGTGGAFKARYGDAPGRMTLREHVRRHTWFSPFWDWALSFWMGQDIDRPTTTWEEMFLPSEIGKNIADFTYTDANGRERRLVSSVEIFNRAEGRPIVPEKAGFPRIVIITGIVLAIIFVFLRLEKNRDEAFVPGAERSLRRIILGLGQSILGLFFGAAGLILFFMTFFTNHDYTYHNINVIFINPLLFAALPWGIIYALAKDEKKIRSAASRLKALWTYVFLAGFLTIIIKIIPAFYQQNQPTQIFVLPFAFVLSFLPQWINGLFKKGLKTKT
jgi:hypothetical protein